MRNDTSSTAVSGNGSRRAAPVALPAAHPLDLFYLRAGADLPRIEMVNGEVMPEPYKQLLVHNNDMTTTLQQYYSDGIHLDVLSRQQRDDHYFREVALVLDRDHRRIEFGAIKINLALFPPAACRQILDEKLPLGQILHTHRIEHRSRPKAFISVQADTLISRALKLSGADLLYGRRNTLVDSVQRPLAEIVEILPPAPPEESAAR